MDDVVDEVVVEEEEAATLKRAGLLLCKLVRLCNGSGNAASEVLGSTNGAEGGAVLSCVCNLICLFNCLGASNLFKNQKATQEQCSCKL